MTRLDDLLTEAMDDLGAGTPHQSGLADLIRRKSRWRRVVTVAPIAAALAVIALVGTILLNRPGGSAPSAASMSPTPASACSPLTAKVLPTWARTGFTDPEPSMPYATSRDGKLIAIVFAQPLVSPALPDRSNKILWAASPKSTGSGPLTVTGTLEGGTATTTVTVEGGPGPSIIDVPVAGCWHFDLTWGGDHDSIDLLYAPS